jgi:UDP-3-O-[3-hydroxymyristoyl] glucosamine N-acyltransferase
MKIFEVTLGPKQIANRLKCEMVLVKKTVLTNVAELAEANKKSVCFFENPKFLSDLKATKAGLIFVPADFDAKQKPDTNLILVDKPYINFMMLVKTWLELSKKKPAEKIADTAMVSKKATLGSNINLGPNCIIEDNVIIGNSTTVESNSVIRKNVRIGENCHIFPNSTIYEDCILKNNVIIHSGCVIGADGFGYLLQEGIQNKIPQVGNVIIEDDVEVGACSCIDRATIGSTIIGKGTKIDNLVQVGHNCKIGENSILCAQVGLAGSTEIGNAVFLAGQVGVAGHLKIDDGAMVGAQSGVSNSIPKEAKYFGTPAIDAGLKKRILASEKQIPNVVKYYKKIMKNEKDKK